MPQTTYMARDPRRDHGFTIPDPQLTIDYGIPNACNRCHTDQTAEWASEWVAKWYGEKMNRPERERTHLIMRARQGDPGAADPIVAFYDREPNAAWKASLLLVLAGHAQHPGVAGLLAKAVNDPSPLVRRAALQTMENTNPPALRNALSDPVRSVRLAASRALLFGGENVPPPARAEIEVWLKNLSDSPAGALQQAGLASIEGRTQGVEFWLGRALRLDPSPGMYHEAALIHYNAGDTERAAALFFQGLERSPDNADLLYALALLEAERQRPASALDLLRRTVKAAPEFGRAWYNLGLAENAAGNVAAALHALEAASRLLPADPEPPYALATIHLAQKQPARAQQAAHEALRRQPGFAPARRLLPSAPSQ